jgi:glutathione S-transferase
MSAGDQTAAACVKTFSEVKMKLLYSTSSPFARKARIVTREKGLLPVVVEIECNPFANPIELQQANRLSKVPTLLTEGLALYDSPVICEYLDSLAEHPRLVPVKGLDRWLVLRAQSLADGLLDIAVALTLEERRPEKEQSASVMKRWREQIQGALDAMHSQSAKVSRSITLGHIAFGAALGYLDFRHPEMRWREGRSALAEWFEAFAKRDSMTQTIPSDQSYRLRPRNGNEVNRGYDCTVGGSVSTCLSTLL